MEIIGTNQEEKQKKSKKLMIVITILIIILLIISIGLFTAIYYLKAQQFKFVIDGKSISSKSMANDLFVYENDNIYVSLRDISELIDYKYYNGGYKQYTEDTTKCYLEGKNEVATFEKDSNTIYKTKVGELDYTYFTLDEPIKRINGKLYISSKGLNTACNLQMSYDKEANRMTIYTLPYLTNYYMTRYSNASLETNFNNQKALLYGLLVVQNVDNTDKNTSNANIRYGIHNLNNEEIVGTKYTNIDFIEGTEEFIVTTEEKKVGIITSEGDTKVNPQYDALKQIDKKLNLYMATTNGKSGIIEKNGKILIYLEYEQIGIDANQFPTNDIKNKYILFDNAIPVKQNGMWGLFDIRGNQILPLEYVSLGCISKTSSNRSLNNILVIPDVEGIVVCQEIERDSRKTEIYGIVNSRGKELIPMCLETVYSVTVSGKDEYTMVNNGNSIDVIEYVKLTREFEEENNKNTTTNTVTNEVSNTIQNTQS